MTSNEDALNVTYLPPRGDLTVDSHVRVDENDTKKSRLLETVRDRDSSNTYSAVDLERSPGKILTVLHQKVGHTTPASCGVDSDVVGKPCSGRDKSNAAPATNSVKVISSYETFASEYAALSSGILAAGAAESLPSSSQLRTKEIISQTAISDTKSPNDSVVERTYKRNGTESTNTRADDRLPVKELKETDIAVYSGVARQDIRPTGMLCARCGQREQKVTDRAVKGTSTERTMAEKATECFILAPPTVDQFCETDIPSTRDMSVQTSDETQLLETVKLTDQQSLFSIQSSVAHLQEMSASVREMLTQTFDDNNVESKQNKETAKSTDQQSPVATVQSSVAAPTVMSAPAREMLTQTFGDTNVKSKQNEDVDDCLTRVVKEVNDMKVTVDERSSPLMYAVPSTPICLLALDDSGTPCVTPCLHVDTGDLVASDQKLQENDGVPSHTLYESRFLKDDCAPVIADHESHCLQEDEDVHVSPGHMLLETPCLHEEDGAQAIDKHTQHGSPHLQGDDGKTFVGDHSLHEVPCLHGEDGAHVIAADHTLHGSPSVLGDDSKPIDADQTIHESPKPLVGDKIVHESPNPLDGDQTHYKSPNPLVCDETVHEFPKPLVCDQTVLESSKPLIGDQIVHESPNALDGDQTVHKSLNPLIGDQTVHESPNPLDSDQTVHESPNPLVGDQTVHESPKPLVGDKTVHESPKPLVDNQTGHESQNPLVGVQIVHESPKPLVDDQTIHESPLQGVAGSQLGTDHTSQPPEETVISTPTTSPSSDDNTESLSFVSRLRNRLRGTLKSIQS